MRSRDKIFSYEMISLLEDSVLFTEKVDKGIFDDLRPFSGSGAPKSTPMGSQWFQMDTLV